jgi:hypothetical protein
VAIQVGVASLWPSTAYKVCQTPFICMKWTWHVYEVDRRSQSQPNSVVSSQMWNTAWPFFCYGHNIYMLWIFFSNLYWMTIAQHAHIYSFHILNFIFWQNFFLKNIKLVYCCQISFFLLQTQYIHVMNIFFKFVLKDYCSACTYLSFPYFKFYFWAKKKS